MITYGTNPGMGMPITGRVPDPDEPRATPDQQASARQGAASTWASQPGQPLLGQTVDVVFIG